MFTTDLGGTAVYRTVESIPMMHKRAAAENKAEKKTTKLKVGN